jgi:hypothetical protein
MADSGRLPSIRAPTIRLWILWLAAKVVSSNCCIGNAFHPLIWFRFFLFQLYAEISAWFRQMNSSCSPNIYNVLKHISHDPLCCCGQMGSGWESSETALIMSPQTRQWITAGLSRGGGGSFLFSFDIARRYWASLQCTHGGCDSLLIGATAEEIDFFL